MSLKLSYDYYFNNEHYTLLSEIYKTKVKCLNDHIYNIKFQQLQRCPVCWLKLTLSKECTDNSLTRHNLELDILIPNINKAIEYNGSYWYSLKSSKMKLNKINFTY